MYSKSWSYREDAILAVYRKLTELSPTTPREELRNLIRAAVSLVKKALLDKVASVSLSLVMMISKTCGTHTGQFGGGGRNEDKRQNK